MVAIRAVFMLVALFLAMVMTISSAPVIDDEFTTKRPTFEDFTTTVGELKETTGLPSVDTSKLLFADNKKVTFGENIKTDGLLPFGKDSEKPILPSTGAPRTFQVTSAFDTLPLTTPSQ